jgi:long-chain acyl-CoA synthetase
MTGLLHHHEVPTATPAPADASVVDVFWAHVDELADRPALRWHGDDGWTTMTWGEYGTAVRRAGAGLLHLGLATGDRVAIMANNRWEWHVADLAIMSIGCVTVPLYQTSSSSQVSYMLGHSEARVCIVENTAQLAKVLLRRHELPALERVFVFDPTDGLDDRFVGVLVDLLELGDDDLGRGVDPVEERRRTIVPDDLATLVYTSGTTGRPKATMLSHRNVTANIRNVTAVVPINQDDRFLSFLPLSHIAERTVSDFGQIWSGGETWFARSLSSVPEDIKACRPTIFFAVPRVWEKFHDAVRQALAGQPRPVRALAARMLEPEDTAGRYGPVASVAHRIEHQLLNATLGRQIRAQMGVDQAHVFVSGAAPVSADLLRWFQRIGIDIAEVYGQTETCGVTTLNPPEQIHVGSVGPPVPGVEVKIGADDEVLVRGDNVSPGYFKAAEATDALIDEDGWLHTGDLGSIDADGYLTITGRIKDLIITSSGKNISPSEIELALRSIPLLSQAVVVGDNRSYLVALLTLDEDAVAEWADSHGKLRDVLALHDDPALLAEVTEGVERVNAELARVEQIKKWTVLPHDLSMDDDEMTPTAKVKRQVVVARNADRIEQLYAN